MSSSLGFRPGCDRIAEERPAPKPRPKPIPLPSKTPTRLDKTMTMMKSMMSPKGLFVTMLLAGAFTAAAPIYFYADPDYTSVGVRGGLIATTSVLALIVPFAGQPAWFNAVLGFYIGLEARVVDLSMQFAKDASTSDTGSALAWTGSILVIVHLIPFLLVDYVPLLIFFAVIGIPINTALLVYIDPACLLVVVFAGFMLLIETCCICGVCDVKCSMMHMLKSAMTEGTFC